MSGRVRGSDELRKRLDKEALPFDWALFEAAQHAPVGLAKHVMRAVIDSSAAGQAGGDAAEEAARLSEEDLSASASPRWWNTFGGECLG